LPGLVQNAVPESPRSSRNDLRRRSTGGRTSIAEKEGPPLGRRDQKGTALSWYSWRSRSVLFRAPLRGRVLSSSRTGHDAATVIVCLALKIYNVGIGIQCGHMTLIPAGGLAVLLIINRQATRYQWRIPGRIAGKRGYRRSSMKSKERE